MRWCGSCILFLKKMYLFIFREKGREGERQGEISVWERNINWLLLATCPNWGPGPQLMHVPWPGIELAIFHFAGWHPIHWATPVRVYPASWCPNSNLLLLKSMLFICSITDRVQLSLGLSYSLCISFSQNSQTWSAWSSYPGPSSFSIHSSKLSHLVLCRPNI